MKKIIVLLLCLISLTAVKAVPAHPGITQVRQPDGTMLSIKLMGDEFYHYTTTADGYTIVLNEQGYYTYAQQNERQELIASAIIAHDANLRNSSEIQFLNTTAKNLVSKPQVQTAKMARTGRDAQQPQKAVMDYSKFKGLVVLVNYKDVKFGRTDAQAFYNRMLNEEHYRGYTNEDGTPNTHGNLFIGSVRDYFRDNSNGIFAPHFDVVGPVDIDFNSNEVNSTSNAWKVWELALNEANNTIDFKNYDADKDGTVDMVYFIVAGYGANYGGNDGGLLWPHKSYLYRMEQLDGMDFGLYACSTEMYGWTSRNTNIIDGIGTICHEFGHVIGLPDFYDTDYGGSGGQSQHPSKWDVMAGGSYQDYGRKPVGYTAFERYALEFSAPTIIDKPGKYTLNGLQSSNETMLMRTNENKEFFMFENRQPTAWDQTLPGHGLLAVRVDSSDVNVWHRNQVNNNPKRLYYEVLRAGNNTGEANATDPFPGTTNNTMLSNTTSPNLHTYNGSLSRFIIKDIREENGVISFTVSNEDGLQNIVEDFEHMPVTDNTAAKSVQGNFTTWDFIRCNVQDLASNRLNSHHAVVMTKPCAIDMAVPLNFSPFQLSAKIYNSSYSEAKFEVYASTDNGASWNKVKNSEKNVKSAETTTATWNINIAGPVRYRIQMSNGNTKQACYLDDITFSYSKEKGEVDLNGQTDTSDVTALINMILGKTPAYIPLGDIDTNGEINVSDVTELINSVLNKN